MNDEVKYWIWLHSIPGVGAVRFRELIDYFGSPEEVWKASQRGWESIPCVNKKIWAAVCTNIYKNQLETILKLIEKYEINVTTLKDGGYPLNLKNIYDPPPVLFSRGSFCDKDQLAVAVVGCRNPTPYGMKIAESVGYRLARNGITVVSGMARGIDSGAHKGALKGDGRTLAVLGSGVDVIYPPENKPLAEKIMAASAILSDYIPGTQPVAANFPPRNRIISGLSLGTVVVEADERSGALITASFALEQNREVFAIPGNLDSPMSRGPNNLIKEGAKLITCVEDILSELNVKIPVTHEEYPVLTAQERLDSEPLGEEEEKIVRAIGEEKTHIDTISARTGYSVSLVSSLLTMLELRGIVNQLPGKLFTLTEDIC